jgi:hypothetical protein
MFCYRDLPFRGAISLRMGNLAMDSERRTKISGIVQHRLSSESSSVRGRLAPLSCQPSRLQRIPANPSASSQLNSWVPRLACPTLLGTGDNAGSNRCLAPLLAQAIRCHPRSEASARDEPLPDAPLADASRLRWGANHSRALRLLRTQQRRLAMQQPGRGRQVIILSGVLKLHATAAMLAEPVD